MTGETGKRLGVGKTTPMLAQYLEIKSQHPHAILLFRMGDFFETFFDDAHELARLTGVVLTTRDARSENPVPLAGVPHHALEGYLAKLLAAGRTVAICEQVEDPALAKGLVKREVVEIVSPGTATSPQLLRGAGGHFCLSFLPVPDGAAGWALIDASTGEFLCGLESAELAALCERHPVREVVVGEDTDAPQLVAWRAALPGVVINTINTTWFHPALAARTLLDHFQVAGLDPFGLAATTREPAVRAAGALLRYLTSLSLRRPEQVTTLRFSDRADKLLLDEETLRNLEVFRSLRGERGEGTLVHHLDATVTPMGRRLLEQRLAEPLTDLAMLAAWHDGVAAAVADRTWRQRLRASLGQVGDIQRWSARAAAGRLGPGQLRQLGAALRVLATVAVDAAAEHPEHPVAVWTAELPRLDDLAARILTTLVDRPPALLRSGGAIRPGLDAELDACLAIARDTRGFLAALQTRERERTGIATLKVGYNKVHGYYFEVTNKHLDKVPADFAQRQTLVNAARFHSPELRDAERKILAAEETAQALEQRIYDALVAAVTARLPELAAAARHVAACDLMLALAEIAEQHRYCRPVLDDSLDLNLEQSRHPVVEQILPGDFIPNDALLDGDQNQIILLTGPNMGGKSTYLRQIALLVLMAQAGSFVPARAARIGWTDRIFTRVGASDNLARGQSTFYSEMTETARILHQMTRRSLVILDEIGRGTATYDGLSLAWAITEHLHDPRGPRPRTVFATHYHELTELEETLPGLVNFRLEVKEWEGKIIFLHSVRRGRSDKSYGIHVARLAGIPEPVLRRAEELLESLSLEDRRALAAGHFRGLPGGAALAADSPITPPPPPLPRQLSLFSAEERSVLESLDKLDLERISPVDAFMLLVKIKSQLSDP